MCLCVFVCVREFVRACVGTCMSMYACNNVYVCARHHVFLCMYFCPFVCLSVCMCVYVRVYMRVCVCMCVTACACMCVRDSMCFCVCIHVCVCVCSQLHTEPHGNTTPQFIVLHPILFPTYLFRIDLSHVNHKGADEKRSGMNIKWKQ